MRGRNRPRTSLVLVNGRLGFLRRRFFPDAPLTRFRHQEQAEHETDRRHCDRVDQRIGEAARRGVSGRSDEGHEAAAPAVADVIRDGNRGVADPAGEIFGEERADRPVHQADIGNHDGDDDDCDRIVDVARLGDRAEPAVQRIVSDRREQEAAQDDRLTTQSAREPIQPAIIEKDRVSNSLGVRSILS